MIRLWCLLVVGVLLIVAAIVSDHSKPIVVESHAPGHWIFEKADYPVCVTVRTHPIPPPPIA
jgi:hypothetical protein